MEVTGYKMQHAIRELTQRSKIAASEFSDNLMQFESDDKVDLERVFDTYKECEQKIARIQELQTRYNLEQASHIYGRKISLCEAVKLVGGAGRMEKMWRDAAKGKKNDRWSRSETSRSKEDEYAKRAVSVETCLQNAKKASNFANALREAIQVMNVQPWAISEEEAKLFES